MPFTGIIISSRLVAVGTGKHEVLRQYEIAALYANHRLGRYVHPSTMKTSTTASRTRDYSEFNFGHDETMAQRIVCTGSPHAEIRPVEFTCRTTVLYYRLQLRKYNITLSNCVYALALFP